MARCPSCLARVARGTPCPRDGVTLPPRSPADDLVAPPAPAWLSLGAVLGSGGSSVVWSGSLPGLPRAAIKVSRHLGERALRRAREEAEALLDVGAPAVPALYMTGRLGDGRPYLAMEWVPGENLAQLLAGAQAPPLLEDALEQATAVAGALAAVHAAGLVHRDVKPENIVVERRADGWHATLLDLGLAGAPEAIAGQPPWGTPEYEAPEQLSGSAPVGFAADVYSLGVLLHEVVTLRLPRGGPLSSELSPSLAVLIRACLRPDPAERPRDAAAVHEALLALAPSV